MATIAPLIVITGPTASGKSGLAMKLAERFGGEIICADSRTIYKGLDIGTAKPSRDERLRVAHHLLDVAEPDEPFSLYDFQRLARQAITDIRARGRIPFLVGGTGLYVDSVVLDYQLGTPADSTERTRLEGLTVNELQEMLEKHHIPLPENVLNKRHLIRAWEQKGINTSSKHEPDGNTIVVAIATEKDELERRIVDRAHLMFRADILTEARKVGERYGWDNGAMTGNIYPLLHRVFDGELTLEEAEQLFIIRDRQLAKRQLTWLRRHHYVQWYSLEQADVYLTSVLESL